jgi:GntR family transcriptional regulator
VVRERGRGTRVVSRPPPAVVTSSVEGWLETASLMGITTEARVLSFDYVAAEPSVAEALELPADARVQRAVRVRLLEGAPFSYLVTYVPEHIGSQYDAADLGSHPLLHLLERAGVRVASARQSITAIGADAEVARALSIQIGAPLLEVQRVVRDSDDRPVEFIRVLYRPELYSFEMSMKRIRRAEGTQWVNTENAQ